jgi:hypothetical protein
MLMAKAKAKAKAKAWPFPALSRHMSPASQTSGKRTKKKGGHHGARPYYIP